MPRPFYLTKENEMKIETIKVKSWVKGDKDGYVIINKEDYDPKKHEIFEKKAEAKNSKK